MEESRLRALLGALQEGEVTLEETLQQLRALPFEELGFATLDHHRGLRQGFPEVIYCEGKTPEQTAQIAERLAARSNTLLGTRATLAHFEAARERLPDLQWHAGARALWLEREPGPKKPGIVVVCAGTSDLPVAEEAALTATLMGHEVQCFHDIGVAGLHRLLHRLPALQAATVIVAVAGMEGALPSVLAGLVAVPVIAVPTSVGYGASFGGLAALLAMLNACASGVAVVNIDNGFGAGYMAAMINGKSGAGGA
ncbi:MAG: nickel pincer cofactor biosynthesis protein LarB [Ardenticatenales bacterium]|nr:nickel pincer cofactor biosynthesis protein LarB [Ardenticatenales bacterium]